MGIELNPFKAIESAVEHTVDELERGVKRVGNELERGGKKIEKEVRRFGDRIEDEWKRSDVLKLAVTAGVIWFTAGTASAYFAAPEAGIGAAMSSSASNMWATTTSFFGAGAAEPAATLGSGVGAGESLAVSMPATTGASLAELETAATAAETATAVGGASQAIAPQASMTALEGGALDLAMPSAGMAGGEVAGGGILGWINKNPIAAMMGGNAISNAASAYAMGNQMEEDRAAEREAFERRGTFGYDSKGNYAGSGSGIIARNMQPGVDPSNYIRPATNQPAPLPSDILRDGYRTGPTGRTVAVPRNRLPSLAQNRQIVRRG